jgi:hypothetical protein
MPISRGFFDVTQNAASADTVLKRTDAIAAQQKVTLNDTIVSALPPPAQGNTLHFFKGAVIQGKTVPSGFAVRVTASGVKAFVIGRSFGPGAGRQGRTREVLWSTRR